MGNRLKFKRAGALAVLFGMLIAGFQSRVASGDPCPHQAALPVDSILGFRGLVDTAFNASVEVMNQDLKRETEKRLGSFRLTTRMLALEKPTKEALADWYFNIVNLNKLALKTIKDFHVVDEGRAAQRLAVLLVHQVVASWLDFAAGTAGHEQGHSDAQKAAGYQNLTFGTTQRPEQRFSIGGLFLHLLAHPTERGQARGSDASSGGSLSVERENMIAAAGINQNERLAELIALEAIDRGGFDLSELTPYLTNKLFFAGYYLRHPKDGDPYNYAEGLSKFLPQPPNRSGGGFFPTVDPDPVMKKIATYSILTAALSGRTWEGLHSAMTFIKRGDSRVDTLKIKTPVGDVVWPEFSTYLNARSVTLRVDAALRRSLDQKLIIAVEKALIGEEALEVSAGVQFGTQKLNAKIVGVGNTRKGLALEPNLFTAPSRAVSGRFMASSILTRIPSRGIETTSRLMARLRQRPSRD